MTVPPALLSHESTEHYTPPYILDAVIACMGAIDLDPASNSREIPNVPAARHYTAQDNGLVRPWEGRLFLNPPFGPGVERWFSKLYLERSVGRTTEAIVLWKSATETAAWKTLTAISCRVCFPSARIRFVAPSGDDGPGPTFSPALFYVGEGPERFERAFAGIGMVWVVPHSIRHSNISFIAQRAPVAISHFAVGQCSGATGSGRQDKERIFPFLDFTPAFIRALTFLKKRKSIVIIFCFLICIYGLLNQTGENPGFVMQNVQKVRFFCESVKIWGKIPEMVIQSVLSGKMGFGGTSARRRGSSDGGIEDARCLHMRTSPL